MNHGESFVHISSYFNMFCLFCKQTENTLLENLEDSRVIFDIGSGGRRVTKVHMVHGSHGVGRFPYPSMIHESQGSKWKHVFGVKFASAQGKARCLL